LLPTWEEGRRLLTLTLPRQGYVYDIRKRKEIGRTARLRTGIEAEPTLYAILPYRVRGISLKVPAGVHAGESLPYKIQIRSEDGQKPSGHIVRVEVLGPGGLRAYYAANQNVESDAFSGQIALALNETPGKWKLRVTDVATGRKAEAAFEVLPARK